MILLAVFSGCPGGARERRAEIVKEHPMKPYVPTYAKVRSQKHRGLVLAKVRELAQKIEGEAEPQYGDLSPAFKLYLALGDRKGAESIAEVMLRRYPSDGARCFGYIEAELGE